MTTYAGETIQIKVEATDFDQSTALDDNDLSAVYLTIFDSSGAEVLTQASVSYDPDEAAWVYPWHTTGVDPGNYRAKIEAYGLQATPQSYSLEFYRIRLNRRPVGD